MGKTVLDSGHRIGNHTHNHLNGWRTSNAKYLENIQEFDQELENSLGIHTDLFRPPYGLIKSTQAKAVLKSKRLVMWNMLSGDYDQRIEPSRILSKSIKNTRSGSIVLFHDQQKTKETIREILPEYLDFLKESGLKTSLL
ncbi:polysaccharide deacetylase family protein [Algoriphagus boritolerans]|uniref:polysaccharide deacetylase family protein n=1 Tax=Algoriphagus boritolerans TaxID=308111 RepID=UPI000A587B61